MGNAESDAGAAQPAGPAPPGGNGPSVLLNVYQAPGTTQMPGFGIYHTGVQIGSTEYSFGGSPESVGCGIAEQTPKVTPPGSQWVFFQTVDLGKTTMTERQVMTVLSGLRPLFPANQYNLVNKNCNHFSELFVTRLGRAFPGWVNRAAKLGNLVQGGVDPLQEDKMRAEAERNRAAEADRKQQERQKAQEVLRGKQQALKPEPPEGAEGVVFIQVHCPNGTKAKRRFYRNDKVADVETFVRAHDLTVGSRSFYLRSNFPRKAYNESQLSLEAAGMSAQENLFVV